jgi:multiple sugar transport system ATP-binding protein
VREPEVFLMDEPLSNLDAQLRLATRAEIIDLHRRIPTTTIYVTHDQQTMTEEQASNFALLDAWLRRWPRSHTAIHPIGKGAPS